MHVVRSLPRCKFFCKWHQDAQNGRRSQPSAAASIEDDLGVSPVPPTGGRGGRCFAYPPLRRRFAYAAASARDWPGPVDGRTGGGGAHKELIQDDVNQAHLLVALLREEGEVNYCAARNAHVQ